MKGIEIPNNPKTVNPIDKYTEVKRSDIHGLGLFAKKLIPKGTIWWHARPQDVLIISRDQFLILDSSHNTTSMKDFMHNLLTYSYYERDLDALVFVWIIQGLSIIPIMLILELLRMKMDFVLLL